MPRTPGRGAPRRVRTRWQPFRCRSSPPHLEEQIAVDGDLVVHLDEEQLGAFDVMRVEAHREAELRADPGALRSQDYGDGLPLRFSVQLDARVERNLRGPAERKLQGRQRSLHLDEGMGGLVGRLAHVRIAIRVPAVERGNGHPNLDERRRRRLHLRDALHLARRPVHLVQLVHEGIGDRSVLHGVERGILREGRAGDGERRGKGEAGAHQPAQTRIRVACGSSEEEMIIRTSGVRERPCENGPSERRGPPPPLTVTASGVPRTFRQQRGIDARQNRPCAAAYARAPTGSFPSYRTYGPVEVRIYRTVASPFFSAARCALSRFIRRLMSSRLSALRWSTNSLPTR